MKTKNCWIMKNRLTKMWNIYEEEVFTMLKKLIVMFASPSFMLYIPMLGGFHEDPWFLNMFSN